MAAVLLLRALLGRWMSPRVRCVLWGLVLLRLLIPFSLPSPWAPQLPTLRPAAPLTAAAVPSTPLDHPPPASAAPGLSVSAEPTPELAQPMAQQRQLPPIRPLLSLLWLMGACCTGGVLWWANRRFFRRLAAGSTPMSCPQCPVPVWQTAAPEAPCLVGVFRPRLYLPQILPESDSALQMILLHETTHLRHRDHWWALLRGLCLCLWWFHPLVWISAARSRRDCELACDAAVLAQMGEEARIPYGALLITLAASGRGAPLSASPMSVQGNVLRERMNIMLFPHKKSRVLSLLALSLALIISACTFSSGQDPVPSPAGAAPILEEGSQPSACTVLLTGQDRVGNTDLILLIRYQVDQQQVHVLDLPRTLLVDTPEKSIPLNFFYSIPGGGQAGLDALAQAVTDLTGVIPDYHIAVDLDGAAAAIDSLGGVWFTVPRDMDYQDPVQGLDISLSQGYQLLDGAQATALFRYRRDNLGGYSYGEEGRAQTQQAFLKALAQQLLSGESQPDPQVLAQIVSAQVTADIPADDLLWLAVQALSTPLDADDIQFHTTPCTPDPDAPYLLRVQQDALEVLIQSYFSPNPQQTH